MNRISELILIKENIITKLITKEKFEKLKDEKMIKGSFMKLVFKYLLFKPFKIEKTNDPTDIFFTTKNNTNYIKETFFIFILPISLFLGIMSRSGISFIAITTMLSLLFSMMFYVILWIEKLNNNLEIREKFNEKNLKNIKENLMVNYNEKEIIELLSNKFKEEELTKIFNDIEKITSKEEIIESFKSLEGKDITDPYMIIKIINDLINKIENKNQITEKKRNAEINSELLNQIIDKKNSKVKTLIKIKDIIKY